MIDADWSETPVPPGVLIGAWRTEQAGEILAEQIRAAIPPIVPPFNLDRLDQQYKANIARWLLGETPTRDLIDEALRSAAVTVSGGGDFIGPMQIGTREQTFGGTGIGALSGNFRALRGFDASVEFGKLIDIGFTERGLAALMDRGITLTDLWHQTREAKVRSIDRVLSRGGLAPGVRTGLLQSRIALTRHTRGFGDL